MDPQVEALALQLTDTAARNTAASIFGRIGVLKKTKKEQETINELEEMVTDLLSDKNELMLIARAYEEELIAQKISEGDIEYIATQFVPVLRKFVESAAAREDQDVDEARRIIDLVQPLLSVEMVTVLQLIGFNFRKAIGGPLTDLVSRLILSKTQINSGEFLEVQRISALRDNAFLEIARDPEAYERLVKMQAERATSESET
jgi:hypothetical protein